MIEQGAEAKIFLEDNVIVKERFAKGYRLSEIDVKLRKQAINFPSPKLHEMCDTAMTLRMEMIEGNKLRDILYQNPLALSEEMGKKIGILHTQGIIHGDLTTSNMILEKEIKFIDFGLSFFSTKDEDKAVDLHLFRQALESRHHTMWEKCFEAALKGYRLGNVDYSSVLTRLEKVESRGRNKLK